jgi:MFS family permease
MIKKNKNFNVLYAMIAAFGLYFSMYAFRKPFAVARFDGLEFLNMDYKIWLVIAQIIGYVISKFYGIKFIAELKEHKRFQFILILIGISELALLFFALIPPPYNIVFLFINGLPLGLIWGLVFSYLEGRKLTELLGIGLASSFILSSGVVKSIGKYLMDSLHVSEFWMPFTTGLLFLIPILIFAVMLEKIPKPGAEDISLKTERIPMNFEDRKKLFFTFWFGLSILILYYLFLTAIRDFRDNFSREIWDELGFQDNSGIYTFAEIPIAILVFILLGFMVKIKKNKKALKIYHYLFILSSLFMGLSTYMFYIKALSPAVWMISIGFAIYLSYVPFNGLFFDRMIAAFKVKSNAGFLIYVADSVGYLGSVLILIFKNFFSSELSWLNFFIYFVVAVAVAGFVISILSYYYFIKKMKSKEKIDLTVEPILIS